MKSLRIGSIKRIASTKRIVSAKKMAVSLFALTFAGMGWAQGSSNIGLYGKGFIGATFPDDVTTEDDVGIVTPDISADEDISFGAAFGMKYGDNIRAEVELANRAHNVSGSSTSRIPESAGLPITSASQNVNFDITITTLMLNGYFDFPLSESVDLFGFGGLGVAFIDADDLNFRADGADSSVTVPGDTTNDFAWQVGVGGAYQVAPDITLELLYRYIDFGTGESEPERNDETAAFGQTFEFGKDSFDLDTQELAIAVRFAF